ncbi:MAG TPA: hypothetical protein PKZ01_05730 [Candidatus Hydrogenedentes bacterium]|nr:hypothetical protein [Candidatus Hydrogenedentota bacterium]
MVPVFIHTATAIPVAVSIGTAASFTGARRAVRSPLPEAPLID